MADKASKKSAKVVKKSAAKRVAANNAKPPKELVASWIRQASELPGENCF